MKVERELFICRLLSHVKVEGASLWSQFKHIKSNSRDVPECFTVPLAHRKVFTQREPQPSERHENNIISAKGKKTVRRQQNGFSGFLFSPINIFLVSSVVLLFFVSPLYTAERTEPNFTHEQKS